MAELKLHSYQERAVERLLVDPRQIELMDPGLGKTAITLTAIAELIDRVDVGRALVIAPLRVCETVWPEEVAKWAPWLRVAYIGNRLNDLQRVDADICLINHERISQLFGRTVTIKSRTGKARPAWKAGPWRNWYNRPDMLVMDESSRFKRSTGVRTRTVKRYLNDFDRRIAMTGSPAPNGLLDLHGQMLLVDGGEALDPRITYYQRRYFDEKIVGRGSRRRSVFSPKEGAFEAVCKAIAPRATVLRAEDWLDLPELITVDVPVALPDEILAAIEQLREQAALELGELEFLSDGGSLTKTRQLVNGMVYEGTPFESAPGLRRWHTVHDRKLAALEDLLDELGRPALVAYEFRSEREEIARRLKGRRIGMIGGGLPAGTAKRAIGAWNAGKLDVLLVHPAAAGHGLNLQSGGNAVVWFAPPWDLELYQQLNARLYRQGQTADRVLVYHLVARGTLDRRVIRVLRKKDSTQESVFDALKEAA